MHNALRLLCQPPNVRPGGNPSVYSSSQTQHALGWEAGDLGLCVPGQVFALLWILAPLFVPQGVRFF